MRAIRSGASPRRRRPIFAGHGTYSTGSAYTPALGGGLCLSAQRGGPASCLLSGVRWCYVRVAPSEIPQGRRLGRRRSVFRSARTSDPDPSTSTFRACFRRYRGIPLLPASSAGGRPLIRRAAGRLYRDKPISAIPQQRWRKGICWNGRGVTRHVWPGQSSAIRPKAAKIAGQNLATTGQKLVNINCAGVPRADEWSASCTHSPPAQRRTAPKPWRRTPSNAPRVQDRRSHESPMRPLHLARGRLRSRQSAISHLN